jgi:hypothetical protein
MLFLEAENGILFIEAVGCHGYAHPSGDMNIEFRHGVFLYLVKMSK